LGGDTVNEFMGVLILLTLLVVYVVSLKLNPYVRCSKCKNKPKIKGWLFTNAHHVCPKCKGTGQQVRFGRKFIFGEPVPPWKR
jgi:DnaJ-class molecular chaperone